MKPRRATERLSRGNPLLRETIHDPYRATEKLRDRTSCPRCGVLFRHGRWTWPESKRSLSRRGRLCPACRRIEDHYPAGEVVVSGRFVEAHRDEILRRIKHIEAAEGARHPLHRIIATEPHGDGLIVTTTDVHLPHRIGHALQAAWEGELQTRYDVEGCFARVLWHRDD